MTETYSNTVAQEKVDAFLKSARILSNYEELLANFLPLYSEIGNLPPGTQGAINRAIMIVFSQLRRIGSSYRLIQLPDGKFIQPDGRILSSEINLTALDIPDSQIAFYVMND